MNKCAPGKKYKDGSCFTEDQLRQILYKYNEYNNSNNDYSNYSKSELVDFLKKKLAKVCSDETCWIKIDFMKELDKTILEETFKPDGPIKKYEWLSTTHINDVLKQYQNLYKEFLFLGAVPYDFEDLEILGLDTLNFDDLINNNKTKIGLVINLDNHDQNGSHWVALYFDLINYQIYFFDSVANPPKKRIRHFINTIIKFMYYKQNKKKLNINKLIKLKKIPLHEKKKIISNDYQLNEYLINILDKIGSGFIDVRYNTKQHQFKNSECGVYSIYFILEILKGRTFEDVSNNIIKDEEMNEFRRKYFLQ